MAKGARQLRQLLDVESAALHLVMFVDQAKGGDVDQAREFLMQKFPQSFIKQVVPIDDDCEICKWYGVTESPTLAIIKQGVILAMIDNCNDESCRWLMSFARQQQDKIV